MSDKSIGNYLCGMLDICLTKSLKQADIYQADGESVGTGKVYKRKLLKQSSLLYPPDLTPYSSHSTSIQCVCFKLFKRKKRSDSY